jgi:hypothetical protein
LPEFIRDATIPPRNRSGRVAKQADASDLKSGVPKGTCGFEPRLGQWALHDGFAGCGSNRRVQSLIGSLPSARFGTGAGVKGDDQCLASVTCCTSTLFSRRQNPRSVSSDGLGQSPSPGILAHFRADRTPLIREIGGIRDLPLFAPTQPAGMAVLAGEIRRKSRRHKKIAEQRVRKKAPPSLANTQLPALRIPEPKFELGIGTTG